MTPEAVVRAFVERVRAGVAPDEAALYMAPQVMAHQVQSSVRSEAIARTPANYAEHIREFLHCFGRFSLQIEELLAQGNKVYVRWRQTGQHLAEIEGYAPTGLPLVTVDSAVYQVEDGKIVAYWIQPQGSGLLQQLQHNAQKGPA